MKPDYIRLADARIRLKSITDYGINWFRTENLSADDPNAKYYPNLRMPVICDKSVADYGHLYINIYRSRRPMIFDSRDYDIESMLKELDHYLM